MEPTNISTRIELAERYEILDELGRGGFGIVYRARQRATGQLVAIKKLLLSGDGDLEADEQRRRFEREMALYARLRSAFVVRLLDAGIDAGGQPFMVLEFVEGRELTHVLREGALTPRAARRIVGQVLEALVEAHGHGIVHRDLKPDNIMISGGLERPTAKVLDFGIAGIEQPFQGESFENITKFGQIRGTPAYMAPEQFQLFDDPRAESDLYAMGLILQECLTGRRAVTGDSLMDVARKQMQEPVVVPAPVRATGFGDVIARAVAKDPTERFRTANEMLHALEAVSVDGASGSDIIEVSTARLDADELEQRSSTGELDKLTVHSQPTRALVSGPVDAPPPAPRSRTPLILAIVVLLAATAATTWWLTRGEGDETEVQPEAQAAEQPVAPPVVESQPEPQVIAEPEPEPTEPEPSPEAQAAQRMLLEGYEAAQRDRHDIARARFEAALALQPDLIDAKLGVARASLALGDATLALETFAELVDDPEHGAVATWGQAQAYAALDKTTEARERAEAYLAAWPDGPDAAGATAMLAELDAATRAEQERKPDTGSGKKDDDKKIDDDTKKKKKIDAKNTKERELKLF